MQIYEIWDTDMFPKEIKVKQFKKFLTVLSTKIGISKATVDFYNLSTSNKVLLLPDENKLFICLDCGDYSASWDLKLGKQYCFGITSISRQVANFFGKNTEKGFTKFRLMIEPNVKTFSVLDKKTSKSFSLKFYELKLEDTKNLKHGYSPAANTQQGIGASKELQRLKQIADEAEN